MENNLKSYNSGYGATSKQFLVPGASQVLLYVLISVSLLIGLNIKNAWHYLNQQVIAPRGGLNNLINQKSPWLSKFVNSLSHSIALQVMFWVAVGCIVYIILWFIRNMSINILNDIAADRYVHPTAYKRSKYWESVLARKVFSGISLVVLIIYAGAAIRLLSGLANLCYGLVTNFQLLHSLLELAGAVLTTAAIIYIFILITHIVVSSWRLIYRDL